MYVSLAVEVRAGLTEALKPVINAVVGMERVHVDFQYPLGAEPLEVVWTEGGPMDFSGAAMKSGRNFLDEVSSFELIARTTLRDKSPIVAARRAVDIMRVAMEWIGDHKNQTEDAPERLGITGLQSLYVNGPGSHGEVQAGTGVTAAIRIPVKFQARLT